MANKTRNFQLGTSGREPGSRTFTSKVRSKSGTKAINVRCHKNDKSQVCATASRLYEEAVKRMAQYPSDEEEKAAERRERKSHKGD